MEARNPSSSWKPIGPARLNMSIFNRRMTWRKSSAVRMAMRGRSDLSSTPMIYSGFSHEPGKHVTTRPNKSNRDHFVSITSRQSPIAVSGNKVSRAVTVVEDPQPKLVNHDDGPIPPRKTGFHSLAPSVRNLVSVPGFSRRKHTKRKSIDCSPAVQGVLRRRIAACQLSFGPGTGRGGSRNSRGFGVRCG